MPKRRKALRGARLGLDEQVKPAPGWAASKTRSEETAAKSPMCGSNRGTFGRAYCVAQRPLSGVERKTYTRIELFRF